ncbi:MAG: translesion DNA synthesis-associated protein ImuA [Burkholderiales bacterium]|nr:translesion DNA synthesis-associated protein ImuA [Burkholderiales bacterium]
MHAFSIGQGQLSLSPEEMPSSRDTVIPGAAPDPIALPWPLASTVWRGNELLRRVGTVVSTGHGMLDRELPGGGWPCGALTELLQPQAAVTEWRVVGPALGRLVAEGGTVLLIGPPMPPHLPGLMQHGLNPQRLVWVDGDSPARRLWATEEAIKANVQGAVLAWLPEARPAQLRRLQSCAQRYGGPVFLFRPAQARIQASPAPLRLLVQPAANGDVRLQVLKRRGALHEGVLEMPALPPLLERVLPRRPSRSVPASPGCIDAPLAGSDSRAFVDDLH